MKIYTYSVSGKVTGTLLAQNDDEAERLFTNAIECAVLDGTLRDFTIERQEPADNNTNTRD